MVAAEVLLHKKCNTNFTQGCGGDGEGETGRKVDTGRKSLFDKLCAVLVYLDDSKDKSQETLENQNFWNSRTMKCISHPKREC